MTTKKKRFSPIFVPVFSALHYCCGQLDLVAAASITTAAPELLESADEEGLTPLHLAVIQGNMALVNLLLANKANVNAVDNEGHSVVHWAAGLFLPLFSFSSVSL